MYLQWYKKIHLEKDFIFSDVGVPGSEKLFYHIGIDRSMNEKQTRITSI